MDIVIIGTILLLTLCVVAILLHKRHSNRRHISLKYKEVIPATTRKVRGSPRRAK